ncbi:MAG: hypothetical protein JWP18_880 [Solirubrobacterales bacterium]|nr:hypothetical protein [Solirubrobacterales bacterium]
MQRPDSRDDPGGGPNTTYGKPFVIDLATGTSAAVPNAILSSRDAFGTADPGWRSLDGFEGPLGGYHCENSEEYVQPACRRTVDAFDDEPPVADLDDPQLRPVARAGGPIRG